MWSTSNDYGLTNIGGDRYLSNYTEIQRQVQLFYELARQLEQNGQVFAQVDPSEEIFKLGQGDAAAAMLYGLKPYMVMQPLGSPTSLVSQDLPIPQVGANLQPQMLKSLLRKIVEES
jgi:hypothetical protein